MFRIIIYSIMAIILFSLFMINVIKMREKDKMYEMVLNHISCKKILLPDDIELRKKDECYKTKMFFKMHNKGTRLNEDIGKIEFEPLDNNIKNYFL